MVKGLDTFQKYFADYEEQYVLIGGAACDILFESNEVNFRATRDLDMVLIISDSGIHTQREWRCCNSNRRQSGFFCTLYFYGIRMPVSKEWIL